MIKNVKIINILLENNRTYQDGYDDDFYDSEDSNLYDKYDDISQEDEDNNLEYLIRTFLSSRGIKSYVETDQRDVIVYVYLKKEEKIRNLTKIFDVMINHMQKETLEGYDLETELYESKEGDNILSFSFYADGFSKDDDFSDVPF